MACSPVFLSVAIASQHSPFLPSALLRRPPSDHEIKYTLRIYTMIIRKVEKLLWKSSNGHWVMNTYRIAGTKCLAVSLYVKQEHLDDEGE
jgi:hypothetical protein